MEVSRVKGRRRRVTRSRLREKRDQERKERTRSELLEAAARVFARKGYHGPKVSDIVAEAGVGQGTFYRHFRDKREIFETLLERFTEELLREFSEMSARLPTNVQEYRDASLGALGRVARVVERNRELSLLFLREAPAADPGIARAMARVYDRFADLARSYLDHAIRGGFARPCRSEVVAQAIVGVALRMAELWLEGRLPGLSLDALITEAVDLVFKGLEPRAGRSEPAGR